MNEERIEVLFSKDDVMRKYVDKRFKDVDSRINKIEEEWERV